MRKYLKIFLLISIFSCDKIESPLPEEYGKFDWSLYPGDPIDYSYDLVNPETNWGPNNNPKSILLLTWVSIKVVPLSKFFSYYWAVTFLEIGQVILSW